MGLYDSIRCEAPLPGTPPAFVLEPNHEFQTKSFDDSYLEHYVITRDGLLLDPSGQSIPFPHGDIIFYSSNMVASAGGELYTRLGEDYEWIEYRARFTHGRLESIEEVCHERKPAKPIAKLSWGRSSNKEDPDGPSRT